MSRIIRETYLTAAVQHTEEKAEALITLTDDGKARIFIIEIPEEAALEDQFTFDREELQRAVSY